MPVRRKKNIDLPANMHFKNGRYRFLKRYKRPDGVRTGKWLYLGKDKLESIIKYYTLILTKKVTTMGELIDRYMGEVASNKLPASYKANLFSVGYLRTAFSHFPPDEITPVHIYQYLDARGQKAPVSANREVALLSHIFSYAIRWGVVKDNPCRNVKRHKEQPRDRYATDHEYNAVKRKASAILQLIMWIKYLTGQRTNDLLAILLANITEAGIYIKQSKTKHQIIIEWTDELRHCIKEILDYYKSFPIKSLYLFYNIKTGQPLKYSGIRSAFDRAIEKALKEGSIKESFQLRDLRAKTATDATHANDARDLLGHADKRITERVYIRKPKKVKPLR